MATRETAGFYFGGFFYPKGSPLVAVFLQHRIFTFILVKNVKYFLHFMHLFFMLPMQLNH